MKNIKYFLATPLFIGVLLSGCNLVGGLLNYGNQSDSSVISESNQFAFASFPSESCGDSLPIDSQVYPVAVYSVTLKNDTRNIEGNRRNVEIIKSRFCPNSSVGVYHEQDEIAQFISRDKASDFKELIESELGNDIIQLSSPQIIEVPPSQIPIFSTKEEIGKAAGLTESQVEQLVSFTNQQIAEAALLTKEQIADLRQVQLRDEYPIIVPTYIPDGFSIKRIHSYNDANSYDSDSYGISGLYSYILHYSNDDNNVCFSLGIERTTWALPDRHETETIIAGSANPLIFGLTADIEYTSHSNLKAGNSLRFMRSVRNRGGRFAFHSLSRNSSSDLECTNALSIEEAIKVIESLNFLFSDHMDVNIIFIGDERYN